MILFLLILNKIVNIIFLCFSFHTTHFLQSLNVECFEILNEIYKKQLKVKNQMSKMYVNKINYLRFSKSARK